MERIYGEKLFILCFLLVPYGVKKMKTRLENKMMDAVFQAKLFLESLYEESNQIRWLHTKPMNSHNEDRNRVELYVLEGSPPRGFIIANYATETVKSFDAQMDQRTSACVLALEFKGK